MAKFTGNDLNVTLCFNGTTNAHKGHARPGGKMEPRLITSLLTHNVGPSTRINNPLHFNMFLVGHGTSSRPSRNDANMVVGIPTIATENCKPVNDRNTQDHKLIKRVVNKVDIMLGPMRNASLGIMFAFWVAEFLQGVQVKRNILVVVSILLVFGPTPIEMYAPWSLHFGILH